MGRGARQVADCGHEFSGRRPNSQTSQVRVGLQFLKSNGELDEIIGRKGMGEARGLRIGELSQMRLKGLKTVFVMALLKHTKQGAQRDAHRHDEDPG